MYEKNLMFIERYNRLYEIAQKVIKDLTPQGMEILPLLALTGTSVKLGLDEVAGLLLESESKSKRDHLVMVYLAEIESHLYRHGYCPSGHMIRILAGNYNVSTEETKQSIISSGFPFRVASVSSADELITATPLRSVTDTEYSDLYERLTTDWGCSNQKEVAKEMAGRLQSINDLLPRSKIGDDFFRVRRGKQEPLPMYVRNEIHHPTERALPETEAFQQDKRIGFAIMEAWLSQGNVTKVC